MKKIVYIIMLLQVAGMMAVSCRNAATNKLEGYEWLEGKWKGDEVQQIFANITPQYYQVVGEMWDEDMNLNKADKKDYEIKIIHSNFLGDVKGICDIDSDDYAILYLDEAKHSVYWVYDFDQKVYLTKE